MFSDMDYSKRFLLEKLNKTIVPQLPGFVFDPQYRLVLTIYGVLIILEVEPNSNSVCVDAYISDAVTGLLTKNVGSQIYHIDDEKSILDIVKHFMQSARNNVWGNNPAGAATRNGTSLGKMALDG